MIVAIIQARMGSSRLPGKMLLPLAGKPVIQWVYNRAACIPGLDKVLVATTVSPKDDGLVDFCRAKGIPVFRGSEEDVLDRFIRAASSEGADVIMRITGDCPLLDPRESGRVLGAFLAMPGCEYACNVMPPFLPDGLDTEVVRFATLERIWRSVSDKAYREHVTYYIPTHPDEFQICAVKGDRDASNNRWTLDEAADYNVLAKIADILAEEGLFGYLDEILDILDRYPEIGLANRGIRRNEGLAKSLQENPPSS